MNSIKPVVMYTEVGFLAVGRSAWIKVVYHHKIPATGLITTSVVLSISPMFTKTGPKFETLNSLYVPADWLEPGTLVWQEFDAADHENRIKETLDA